MLRLDAVAKSYRRGSHDVRVLRDVSLDVRPGELVAVYGQRAAGKTTLLRIAAGLEEPDGGRVELEGRDIATTSPTVRARMRREAIAWVERAGPRSTELTVDTYLAMSLYYRLRPREAHGRALAALERVGAADCAKLRWADLSDTARILVAIAHGLVRRPTVLVADDPTVGLGIVERELIVGLLRTIAEDQGVGVLMAVPDAPSTVQAHHLHGLSRGRLVSPGDGRGKVVDFPVGGRRT